MEHSATTGAEVAADEATTTWERAKRFLFSKESVLPLLLGLTGFAVAYLVFHWGNGTPGKAERFVTTPQYRLWALLICAQMSLWLALSAPLVKGLLRKGTWEYVWTWGVGLKVFVLAGFLLWGFNSAFHELPVKEVIDFHPYHVHKLKFFNVAGGLAALLAIAGIWATQAALKEAEESPRADRAKRVGHFLTLRSQLEQYLLAAGTIIGAATLATGALRQSVLAYDSRYGERFMVQDVLGYGLTFSLMLALVYAPAHMRLVSARAALHRTLVPLPKPDADDPHAGAVSWDAWNKEHKAAGELLQPNAGLFGSLAGAVSILTPLLGSLVSLLLK
jgi:hypothetical protein